MRGNIKSILICLVSMTLACTGANASHYEIDANPWNIEFDTSLNLSFKVDVTENYTIVHMINSTGKEPATITIFTRSWKVADETMNIFLNSYIKSINVASPTRKSITIDGSKGILAEGHSEKYNESWQGAIWPYRPYFDPANNANWTSAMLLLEGTLEPAEFQGIIQSLRVNKPFLPAGRLIRADTWIFEFNPPLKLSSKVDISPEYTIIHLVDSSDIEPASFAVFNGSWKATNETLNIFINSYIKSNNVTSPTWRAIVIDGSKGTLAIGYSEKYKKSWRGAVWPFKPYLNPADNVNRTGGIILFEGMLDAPEFMKIIGSLHVARHYRLHAGPWIVEFNSTQSLKSKIEYSGEDGSGTFWFVTLIDGASHEVAWLALFSSPNLKSAASEFMDDQLNVGVELSRVTSPTKTSVMIDGTEGRMAEGYSSKDSRYWRSIFYPYKPFFDSFTNTNMSMHRINFQSIQDLVDFQEIADSLHVTYSAES